MKYKIALLLSISLLELQAQEILVLSSNPAKAKWYQLKTPGFKIIYTKGFEEQAQRMANTMETIREPEAKSMNTLPRRITLVMQSLSSQSNAFVTLAPRRSEFYSMPSQDYNFMGNNDWLNLLASHEYRHIAQFQRSITGFNKFLLYAFGQEAVAGMAFASAPQWFWEGDAVATETAFTKSGRGRIPNFDLVFRTNLLEGRAFNYNKQYLRSYKNFIPNHYVLGYNMVSAIRRQTGNANSLGNIATKTWNVPFLPFAFSSALKKETGLSMPKFYKKMAADLKSEYEKQLSEIELTKFETVTIRKNEAYTDYLYPQVLENGSMVALKSGIGDIQQLVMFKDGEAVSKKFVVGIYNESGFLSAAGNTVVWNEFRFDPRWPVRDYSIIRGYDFGTKLQHQSTRKTRYAGAAISPDSQKILTAETDTSYQMNLVVIDYASGNSIKKFSNPENAFYSMARWADNGNSIVSLKTTKDGKSVVKIDYASGNEQELLPVSDENIGHPVLVDGYLLYNSPRSGIDNIYALDLKTSKQFQITSAKYGAYNPCLSADGKTLYYNNQGRNGMDVVKMDFNPARWKPIEQIKVPAFNTYSHLVEQEGNQQLFSNIPTQQFAAKRYRKILHQLNIHSWGGYVESDLTRGRIGITSKNILSTTQFTGGYEWDNQERSGSWKATASFQSWYPIVDVSYTSGNRKANLGEINYKKIIGSGSAADTVDAKGNLNMAWREETLETGLRLPFNLTSSKFFTNFSISNYLGVTQVSKFDNGTDNSGRLLFDNYPQIFLESYQDNGKLIYNTFNLNFYNLLKRSTRDINSKWGQATFLKSTSTPLYGKNGGGDFEGKNFSLLTYMYLPGFFKHHSLWGYWAYQGSSVKNGFNTVANVEHNYVFRNQIPLPRGVSDYIRRFEKIYSMSLNYTMPVWYPDIALGPWINFKRIRANAFMDYAFGDSPQLKARLVAGNRSTDGAAASFLSTGIEIKLDMNLMRFLPEFDLGFRYSYGLKPSVTKFEVLLGTFNF